LHEEDLMAMSALATKRIETPRDPKRVRRERFRKSLFGREARIAYLFLLPYLILFVLFRFGPAVASFVLSLFNYRITGAADFVGTSNYSAMASDPTFWKSLTITLLFSAISVPLVTVTALGAALLINRRLPGIAFFRTVYFLPVVTSLVLAGVVWQWIYGLDGPLNAVLGIFGIDPVKWIQSSALVIPSVAIVAAWNRFGFGMLIFLAGLQAIPAEYKEAAKMDGAGAWTSFRHITWPQLRPQVFFVLVIETIYSFQVFDAIYVMTGGGPARGSYTLVYMIYEQGFKFFNYGYASAIGVALFAVTFILALVQRRFFGREDS
jgi:multiple sugar transport system permease protein